MSPRYVPSDIDLVRERADIVEVVGEHVQLRRQGRDWVGLCPFHQERTPSFRIDRDKGLYHCHGCKVGGNVFHFLQEHDGLSFAESVEVLAKRYDVELREQSGQKRTETPRARLLALHEAAVVHYAERLLAPDAAPVRAYLDERGIDRAVREVHRVGFGGWARDGLVRTMLRKGYTGQELLAAGLAGQDGRALRDSFHGRVLFAISDPSGRPVGFGGRVLPDQYRREGATEHPKYLNTRETQIFHKSKVLYGADRARGDVVRTRRLVIVEGYTDVIAMHAAGFRETVATCGTSLTEQHMQDISRRFGDVRVILCLDADAAGQAAMARGRTEELAGAYSPGELTGTGWLPIGKGWLPEVYVATLPEGQDPADFVRTSGADKVDSVLRDAVPLVEFLLLRAISPEDLGSPEGRARAVRRSSDVLAQVGDPLLRHEYGLWLADRVRVDPYEVSKAVESRAGRPPEGRRTAPRDQLAEPVILSGHQRVEREVLRAIVQHPKLLDEGTIAEDDLTLPMHRSLFRLLCLEREQTGAIEPGRLAERVTEPELRRAVTAIAVGEPVEEDTGRETLVRLKGLALARQIQECQTQLRKLDPHRDETAYDALFERAVTLEKQRRLLLEGH